MPDTMNPGTTDRLREHVSQLAQTTDCGVSPAFLDVMKSVLTATENNDPALIQSHLHAALEFVKESVHEQIERLQEPDAARRAIQGVWDEIEGHPFEDVDDLGKDIESTFDKRLKDLTDFRDGLVRRLMEHGFDVKNSGKLDRCIEALQELKAKTLQDWPWISNTPPTVDRKMVEESRAGIKRGEGEPIRDVIRRMGDTEEG